MTTTLSLLQIIEQKIVSGQINLPACNEITGKLNSITSDPDFNVQELVDVIIQDQSLTAEILRVANSSFYGGLTEVTTVTEAAIRLGPPELIKLAVMVTEKSQYTVKAAWLWDFITPLWGHSVAVATGASWLAQKLGYNDLTNEAFIGGLLHDVGSLVLIRAIDDICADDQCDIEISENLVRELLNSAHAEQGFNLVQQWGLPEIYCNVVRHHHDEHLSEQGTLLNIISLANKACSQLGIGLETDASIVLEATEEAHNIGATDILLAQLSIMLEDSLALA